MRYIIIRIILLVFLLLNLQFISISVSAHNLINASTQDKAIFEWCITNTELYLNYKFEDLEVYYSNTYKEYREMKVYEGEEILDNTKLEKNIKIRNFIYKEDIGHDNLIQNGIFAQDLRDILKKYNIGNRPYLQWEYNDDRDDVYYDINAPEKDDMFYEINYSSMIPLLIKGWQINENKISHLKDKIKELEEM